MSGCWLIIGLLLPSLALAQPTPTDLFAKGAFAEAIAPARALETAAGDALAARALLVVAAYETPSRLLAERQIDIAISDAERARRRDPANIEALLQQAIGLGYKAKLNQSPALAKDARKLMDLAYARAPDNAFAAALLGGWHGESVADLGAFLAGTVLGAKRSEALRFYQEAIRKDPASPTFLTFYAFTLVKLNSGRNGAEARRLLEQAKSLTPRDGFERMMQTHGAAVLTALVAGNGKRALQLVKTYEPFGRTR